MHDAFLQRLNEVDARVAARHFRSLQVYLRQFLRAAERFTVGYYFRDHSPFMGRSRRQRLWVEKKRFGSSCSGAITPRGKDSVARHDAGRVMPDVLEGGSLGRHNHIGEEGIV